MCTLGREQITPGAPLTSSRLTQAAASGAHRNIRIGVCVSTQVHAEQAQRQSQWQRKTQKVKHHATERRILVELVVAPPRYSVQPQTVAMSVATGRLKLGAVTDMGLPHMPHDIWQRCRNRRFRHLATPRFLIFRWHFHVDRVSEHNDGCPLEVVPSVTATATSATSSI